MRNMVLILIILVLLCCLCGLTAAKLDEPKEKQSQNEKNVRLIARTTSIDDKADFLTKGCKLVHDLDELEDAIAIECPAGIAKKLENVEEDSVFTIMDTLSNQQIYADDIWTSPGIFCTPTKMCDGSGVTVAVLDTGVDTTHPELQGSISGGKSFVRYTKSYQDDHGHGTHVSGIITANGVNPDAKGVAPGTSIWVGKVLDAKGSGYVTDIAAAINYVVKYKKAQVISMSLGGGGTGTGYCDYDYLAYTANKAVSKGVTVVAAAGNTPGKITSPACGSKTIAVGAVDDNDGIASFSGSGNAINLVAPGVTILSSIPINGYASWSGTSMATPHVSATVAMILEKQPTATVGTISNQLYACAKDLGTPYWDTIYGMGRLNAFCSVGTTA